MNRNFAFLLFITYVLTATAAAQLTNSGPTALAQDTTLSVRAHARADASGSISGRVVNEDGSPASRMLVWFNYGRRGANPYRPTDDSPVRTDREGRFRADGLPPGEYIVSTTRLSGSGGEDDGDGADEPPYYKTERIFYGDALDWKDAEPVVVRADSETADVEITLRRHPLRKVSGSVLGRDGRPLPGAEIVMTRRQKPDTPPYSQRLSTYADAQGIWSLEVPDGLYLLEGFNLVTTLEDGTTVSGYRSPPDYQPRANVQTESPTSVQGPGLMRLPTPLPTSREPSQPKQVSVSGSDVPGVLLDMNRRRQVVSGWVLLEDGKPMPPDSRTEVDLNNDYKTVADDGSFELKGEELGQRFLNVYLQPYATYYVKSITWGDADYLRQPFEYGNGIDYVGVRVVVARGGALLEAQARGPAAAGGAGARLWLIPTEEADWRAPQTWFSSAFTKGGKFSVYAAPGNYFVVVDEKDRMFGPHELDEAEDFARGHANAARRITLKDGERKSLGL